MVTPVAFPRDFALLLLSLDSACPWFLHFASKVRSFLVSVSVFASVSVSVSVSVSASCSRQPIAVSDISIYINLIFVRSIQK